MRRLKGCAALILFVLFCGPLAANPTVESFEWPKAGMVAGERVNLRAGPSTSSKIVGRFVHDYDGGELLVTGRTKTNEEYPWYRVISHKFGEGWLYGKYLAVEEPDGAVRRYALKIREDFGLSPEIAVRMYGEPMKRNEKKMHIPDFNTTVHIVTLVFHGHTATYWNGTLQSVEIPAGFMGFADILLGIEVNEAVARLGEVSLKEGNSLIFIAERDEITVETEGSGGRAKVAGLSYRRVIYD
jgi:hypothetical protein